jgi:hypothetical protein
MLALRRQDNELEVLPDASVWGGVKGLQVLNLAGNKITSMELQKIGACLGPKLTTLQVDRNELDALPLPFAALQLLDTLTAAENEIQEIGEGVGLLKQLMFLNLEDNKITELPVELSQLSVKKLKEIKLSGNPLRDPKCRRILEKEKLPVKPLLQYLAKVAKSGGGKKSKKKEAAAKQPKALSTADMIARIHLIYEKKNPDKLGDVPKIMAKYTGKETALYAAMLKKYEVDEGSFFTSDDEDDEDESEEEAEPAPAPKSKKDKSKKKKKKPKEESDEDEPEPQVHVEADRRLGVGMPLRDIRKRVRFVYEQQNPDKVRPAISRARARIVG